VVKALGWAVPIVCVAYLCIAGGSAQTTYGKASLERDGRSGGGSLGRVLFDGFARRCNRLGRSRGIPDDWAGAGHGCLSGGFVDSGVETVVAAKFESVKAGSKRFEAERE